MFSKFDKGISILLIMAFIKGILGGLTLNTIAIAEVVSANGVPGEDEKIYFKGSSNSVVGKGYADGKYVVGAGGITYASGATLESDWRGTAENIPGQTSYIEMSINVIEAGEYYIELGNKYTPISPISVSVNSVAVFSVSPNTVASETVRWDSIGKHTLIKGVNTIKISTTARGYLRMDTISISTVPTVPTSATLLAQDIADGITLLYQPIRDALTLSMPTIDSTYKAEISTTEPSGIIYTNATITRPAIDTIVKVIVKISSKTNVEDVAYTKELRVPITSKYTAPIGGDLVTAKDKYGRKKTGLFVHYVPHLTSGYNGTINDIDVLADTFNVEEFANNVSDMGVEYVVFTAWHARMLTLFPSQTNKRWRDYRRLVPQNKSYSDRDVIKDLMEALKAKNIELHLYFHPTDGQDFLDRGEGDNIKQDQELTGYGNKPVWNEYVNELVDEMCRRYGEGIKGVWIDGVSDRIEYSRLNKTLRAYNPNMMIIENAGTRRYMDFPTSGLGDYYCWEINNVMVGAGSLGLAGLNANIKADDGKTWPGSANQVAIVLGDGWWSKDTTSEYPPLDNQNDARYLAKDMFLYNVLLASVSKTGGLLYAVGCGNGIGSNYSGGDIWGGGKEGGGNLFATIKEINALIKPIKESIRNTNVGKAYVTTNGSWLDQYNWGVSTESSDSKYVYLHIVKAPVGKTLSIENTQDGTTLCGPATLLNTNTSVEFTKTESGYNITLPENATWDSLDTVIKVQRQGVVILPSITITQDTITATNV